MSCAFLFWHLILFYQCNHSQHAHFCVKLEFLSSMPLSDHMINQSC